MQGARSLTEAYDIVRPILTSARTLLPRCSSFSAQRGNHLALVLTRTRR